MLLSLSNGSVSSTVLDFSSAVPFSPGAWARRSLSRWRIARRSLRRWRLRLHCSVRGHTASNPAQKIPVNPSSTALLFSIVLLDEDAKERRLAPDVQVGAKADTSNTYTYSIRLPQELKPKGEQMVVEGLELRGSEPGFIDSGA
jgi:hypothetical protein